jgi:hypothetical protein
MNSMEGALREVLNLSSEEIAALVPHMQLRGYKEGETIFSLGDPSTTAYLLVEGRVGLAIHGQVLAQIGPNPQFFGGVGMSDNTPRRSACVALGLSQVASLSRQAIVDQLVPAALSLKLLFHIGGTVNALLSGDAVYSNQDVLLVQDGGCSPGYNSVTAYLVEEFEKRGRRVTIAATGFKSLVSNTNTDYHILVHSDKLFKFMSLAPGVVHAPMLLGRRGAAFRTERYPQFKDDELQRQAAWAVTERKVRTVVAVGGNGTFAGIQSLARFLPPHVQVFFVPVTIDSDVGGTETIGQHTAVEFGAEKIRCYVADAATHERCYILEMMGRGKREKRMLFKD